MERLRLGLTLFILSFGWLCLASSSSVSCSVVLGSNQQAESKMVYAVASESAKLKEPEVIYHLKFENDVRFRGVTTPEELVDLFQMLGQTQFFNTSEKLTLEKGTLYLGSKIDDLITAQAEYTIDKPNKVLHLVRLSIVNSKNGQEQVLTKEPTQYTGTDLARSDFSVVYDKGSPVGKILAPQEIKIQNEAPTEVEAGHKAYQIHQNKVNSAQVKFPTSISGDAFQKISKWSLVASHLDHSEINIVDSVHKKNWAIAKGNFRRFVEFAKDRFFKQAFGLLVVYMVFDGMSGFAQDVAKYAVNIIQTQEATVSVKVKETKLNGEVTNKQQKYKITFPKNKVSQNPQTPEDQP